MPMCVTQGDGDAFVEMAEQMNSSWPSEMKCSELSADLMRQFAYQATGNICPMQAVIGGIAAQEVMKVTLRLTSEYDHLVNFVFPCFMPLFS